MARIAIGTGRHLLFFLVAATAVILVILFYIVYTSTNVRYSDSSLEKGYILALKYSDQLTGGALNMLSLMCLATEFGEVRVVEPFLVNSDFGLNASMKWTKQIKFRDVYDISVLTRFASGKHYNHLVPYQTFIKNAPSKVVLVQYHHPCGSEKVWNTARAFCRSNGFELIGVLCLTYGEEEAFTVDTLRKQIYSQYHPAEVVVLFDLYGGIVDELSSATKGYRLSVSDTQCGRNAFADKHYVIQPSRSVFSDANAYIQKYLNTSASPSYISVMIRLERILQQLHSPDPTLSATNCLNNILAKLRDIRYRTGIKNIFVSIDVGVYGSRGLHTSKKRHALLPPVKDFFSALYSSKVSLQEWESTFSSVGLGRTKSSGYIAMMQKVIAVKGNILVLVGSNSGSTFQTTSKYLYHRINRQGQLIELDSNRS